MSRVYGNSLKAKNRKKMSDFTLQPLQLVCAGVGPQLPAANTQLITMQLIVAVQKYCYHNASITKVAS